MSTSRLAFVVPLTLLGGLAGCQSSPPGGAVFYGLCDQADTHCSRLYACATPSRLSLEQMLFGHHDEASCVVATSAVIGATCGSLGEGLDAGRASVDLERLTACSDFLDGLSCEDYLNASPTEPPCAGSPFVTGLVGSGGACALDIECATAGEACSSDGTTLGTCDPRPGVGEACIRGEICAAGLHCDAGVCMEGCSQDSDCPGEWCDQPGLDARADVSALLGVCAPLRALGEECEVQYTCEPGLYCERPGLAFELGYCATPRAAGEVCNEPIDCVSRSCPADVCE